jgi:CPA2 family monovalent cation:H+ antiporter-2
VAAVISITLNPIIYSRINPMFRKLEQTRLHAWIMRRDHENSLPPVTEDTQRLIVVGFGPVGRTLVRILERNNIEPVIIEMNIDTVKKLRKENKLVVHGDATLPEVLNHAGVNKAQGIIISSSAIPSREVVEAARSINPDIPVTIYSFYLRDVKILRGKKNTTVISGEESAAIAMASHLMRTLGATEEQIDNEQRRIHETLS